MKSLIALATKDYVELTEEEKTILIKFHRFMLKYDFVRRLKRTPKDGGPWLIYFKGDNTFIKTKYFARIEFRRLPNAVQRENKKRWTIVTMLNVRKGNTINTLYSNKVDTTRKGFPSKLKQMALELRDEIIAIKKF